MRPSFALTAIARTVGPLTALALMAGSAAAESISYKNQTVGSYHNDTRFAGGLYTRLATGGGSDLAWQYGFDAAYSGFGGFVPKFLWVDGRAGLTMTGYAGDKGYTPTGVNVRGRVGLGSRGWSAGTQHVVRSSSSYSTGTTTVTTTKYIMVPFVPHVAEKAYYVGLELQHVGLMRQIKETTKDAAGKEKTTTKKVENNQALLLAVGSHTAIANDCRPSAWRKTPPWHPATR
jgi:hypothetical protein